MEREGQELYRCSAHIYNSQIKLQKMTFLNSNNLNSYYIHITSCEHVVSFNDQFNISIIVYLRFNTRKIRNEMQIKVLLILDFW